MIKHISVGIDIGSRTTRLVVAENKNGLGSPVVLSLVSMPTHGVRHGYIINPDETKKVVASSIQEAEKISNVSIKKALVSIGGISLSSVVLSSYTMVSRADKEITELDIDKAVKEAEKSLDLVNRKIIFKNIISYKIDNIESIGNPVGMKAVKVEVKVLFIYCLEQHINLLEDIFLENQIEIVDIIPSPIAGALAVLSERQKSVGVCLVNIGAETVSVVVYENNVVIGLHVFNIGSNDITNDIALGFKIPLNEAEFLKLGTKDSNEKRKLENIIDARLSDIFELINKYLKKIKRNELLPAGIVLTGGGSSLSIMEEISKKLLKLPTKMGLLEIETNSKNKIRDANWNVPYGLVIMAREYDEFYFMNSLTRLKKNISILLKDFLKQFLP